MGGNVTEGGDDPALAPLFPLHTVLFPGGVLPLHLFERRYQLLVEEGLNFVVVLIRSGSEVGHSGVEGIHAVGTMASPTHVQQLPDGDYAVRARGLHRVRILSVDRSGPYLRGLVRPIADPATPPSPWLVILLRRTLANHGVEMAPEARAELLDPARAGPIKAVWLAGAMLQGESRRRQWLLESGDPALAEFLLEQEA